MRRRQRRTGFGRTHPFLSRAAWRGPAAGDPHTGHRRQRLSGECMLISIAIGLAGATLIATGLLFVAQAYEDFRGD